ncbi:MAG TPA: amidase family protein, partial [Janthinobacterium sp.]|nr:amidase family protein [Janthinobacterium sp.]
MDRRNFVRIGLAAGAAASVAQTPPVLAAPGSKLVAENILDAGVQLQQERMKAGKLTSHMLVSQYLSRIAAVDKAGPRLNAIIELNPDALKIAAEMDRERKAGKVRGPLHGIPVLLKDNIATGDRMSTSAGSLALAGVRAARDSFVAARLRAAGAVIIGKTNLSEWANMRSTHSVSGWSGRGGLTRNPYALDRNTSGSSSGSGAAIAAGLATLAVGTETDGSIVSPSSLCGLVGIKPTLGLVSRSGIIPIAHSQDTAGPMARSVADAALMLAALAGVDASDAATRD